MEDTISHVIGTLGFLCLCYSGWAYQAHLQKKADMKIAMEDGAITKDQYEAFLRGHRYRNTLRDPKYVFRTVARLPNT